MIDWTAVASLIIGDSLLYMDFNGEVLPLEPETVKELYVPLSEPMSGTGTGEILPGQIIAVILEDNGKKQTCFASPQEGTKIQREELTRLMGTEPERGRGCFIYNRRK